MNNEKEFIQYLAKFNKKVNDQYNKLIDELSRVGMSIDNIPDDQLFSFANYPQAAKEVAKKLQDYERTMKDDIVEGMKAAITMSFAAAPRTLFGHTVWEEAAINKLRDDTSKAWIADRLVSKEGLNLSQRVWNYTQQSKAEFEMAMSDLVTKGIKAGTSAEEIARSIKGLLNNPDSVYRRYHLKKVMADGSKKDVVEWRKKTVDADGKVHFMSTDIEHPGVGVYRSSRQNALRLAATEVNCAYRFADCTRWDNEWFVMGIRIRVSENHVTDMCDDLAGDYPKWFMWDGGWHPRCRCSASSILMEHDEFMKVMKMPKEDRVEYVSDSLVTDMPEGYTKYVETNRKRIERAIERGTQPWWIKKNYVDGDINNGLIGLNRHSIVPGAAPSPAPGAAVSPFGNPTQTKRTDGAVLSEAQMKVVMDADRALYTPEQLANMDKLEKLFGVPRGTSMSWELANKGSENPLYAPHTQWADNCQTCTVTHELRRRGFNVDAKGVVDGFNSLRLPSGDEFGWRYRFLNPDGSKIDVEWAKDWAKDKGYSKVSRKRLQEYFDEKLAEDGRYEIYCRWSGKSSSHVYMAEVKNGKVLYFDPQTGESGAKIAHYFTDMATNDVYAMRIDDKIINPHMVQAFNAERGIIDTTGFVIKSPKELARDAHLLKRDEVAIKENSAIRDLMDDDRKREYLLLNRMARRNGQGTYELRDIWQVDNGKLLRKSGALSKDELDAVQKLRRITAALDSKLNGVVLGKVRTEKVLTFIEGQKLKTARSIGDGTTTWNSVQSPVNKLIKKLQAERAVFAKALQERKARLAAAVTKTYDQATTWEELRDIYGGVDKMPKTLQQLPQAITDFTNVSSSLKAQKDDVEKWMRELLDKSDFGMQVRHEILDSIADKGFLNTFEVGSSGGYKGSGKTSGKIEEAHGRLVAAHLFFDPAQKSQIHLGKNFWEPSTFKGNQWERKEYERYGHLLLKDKEEALKKQTVSQYGDCQVRFKKDKVCPTWTLNDSLCKKYQPTLCADPKIESFDNAVTMNMYKQEFKDVLALRKAGASSYIELQYHGELTLSCVESITLPSDAMRYVKDATLKRWADAGVRIFYEDKKTGKVVEKFFLTPKELLAKRQAARKAYWDAEANKAGKTRDELLADMRKKRAAEAALAKDNAKRLLDVALDVESADLKLDAVRAKYAKGDWLGARREAEEFRAKHALMKAREDKIKDLIPDVKDWHKKFTIDELEDTHKAISKKLAYFEGKYPDLEKRLQKLTDERAYTKDPTIFSYGAGKKPHKLWEVSYGIYDREVQKVAFTIEKNATEAALAELKTYKTSAIVKKYAKEAEELIAKGELDAAMEKIKLGNERRIELETKAALRDAKQKLGLGESNGVKFDSSEFTQERRDAALWFKESNLEETFKKVDAYMSHYAEEMWTKLTYEEKQVLWLYTDGSKFINEEIRGEYKNRLRSAIDLQVHNGLHDANVLATAIEKAPALKESMWMQSATKSVAIENMFGINPDFTDISKLVGKEGGTDTFLSCHSCANGAFVRDKVSTGGGKNNVVLSIYMPKGTKGAYCEPFASYGDDIRPKRGKDGFDWDGKRRNEKPSEQVEFLLQRGARFRVTKAYYKDGKYYIDVDLIEQKPLKALDTKILGFEGRPIRKYRKD